MNKTQQKKYIKLIKGGMVPRDAYDSLKLKSGDGNINAMRELRKFMEQEEFQSFMHTYVMPNRICKQISKHIEYLKEADPSSKEKLISRIQQLLDENK